MNDQILNLLSEAGIDNVRCENVSYKHEGHAHFGGTSHFELHIPLTVEGQKSLLAAHQKIYEALKPIYPSQIHSISLVFIKP